MCSTQLTLYSLLFVIPMGKAYCLEFSHIFSQSIRASRGSESCRYAHDLHPRQVKVPWRKIARLPSTQTQWSLVSLQSEWKCPTIMTPCSSFYTAKLSWQNAENIKTFKRASLMLPNFRMCSRIVTWIVCMQKHRTFQDTNMKSHHWSTVGPPWTTAALPHRPCSQRPEWDGAFAVQRALSNSNWKL